jgi:hypothetical protein
MGQSGAGLSLYAIAHTAAYEHTQSSAAERRGLTREPLAIVSESRSALYPILARAYLMTICCVNLERLYRQEWRFVTQRDGNAPFAVCHRKLLKCPNRPLVSSTCLARTCANIAHVGYKHPER